jgi:hypothetical protein
MSVSFVLGNGRSRLEVNLYDVQKRGTIYGCNALYRDFRPDVLISTDRPISERIQQEGYASQNRMYTRKPISGSGALRVPQQYYGYSSGPIAVGQAALDGAIAIYMIGFDLGALPQERFNNVYADTEFYKKSSSRPTYTGNWVRQIRTICGHFPQRQFVRVMGETAAEIREFEPVKNLRSMPMAEFLDRINNCKDL